MLFASLRAQEDILQLNGLGTSSTFDLTAVGLPDAEVSRKIYTEAPAPSLASSVPEYTCPPEASLVGAFCGEEASCRRVFPSQYCWFCVYF